MGNVARDNAEVLRQLAMAPAPPSQALLDGAVTPNAKVSWSAEEDPERAGFEILLRETTEARWEVFEFVTTGMETVLKRVPPTITSLPCARSEKMGRAPLRFRRRWIPTAEVIIPAEARSSLTQHLYSLLLKRGATINRLRCFSATYGLVCPAVFVRRWERAPSPSARCPSRGPRCHRAWHWRRCPGEVSSLRGKYPRRRRGRANN